MPVRDPSRFIQTMSTPSHVFITMAVFMFAWIAYVKIQGAKNMKSTLELLGIHRIKRTMVEIERKTIHLSGVLIPLAYQLVIDYFGTEQGWGVMSAAAWFATITCWSLDITRISFPWCKKNWPLQRYLRPNEMHKITGMCYFSLGCTISITFFDPNIAMTSILFLVLGDLSAALFGVAYGGDTVVVKLGREGKKSAEGSIAMFIICYITGTIYFWNVHLREYPIFFGALAATLTELHEPLYLNDNLTIPLISSATLSWAFARIHDCGGHSYFEEFVSQGF